MTAISCSRGSKELSLDVPNELSSESGQHTPTAPDNTGNNSGPNGNGNSSDPHTPDDSLPTGSIPLINPNVNMQWQSPGTIQVINQTGNSPAVQALLLEDAPQASNSFFALKESNRPSYQVHNSDSCNFSTLKKVNSILAGQSHYSSTNCPSSIPQVTCIIKKNNALLNLPQSEFYEIPVYQRSTGDKGIIFLRKGTSITNMAMNIAGYAFEICGNFPLPSLNSLGFDWTAYEGQQEYYPASSLTDMFRIFKLPEVTNIRWFYPAYSNSVRMQGNFCSGNIQDKRIYANCPTNAYFDGSNCQIRACPNQGNQPDSCNVVIFNNKSHFRYTPVNNPTSCEGSDFYHKAPFKKGYCYSLVPQGWSAFIHQKYFYVSSRIKNCEIPL